MTHLNYPLFIIVFCAWWILWHFSIIGLTQAHPIINTHLYKIKSSDVVLWHTNAYTYSNEVDGIKHSYSYKYNKQPPVKVNQNSPVTIRWYTIQASKKHWFFFWPYHSAIWHNLILHPCVELTNFVLVSSLVLRVSFMLRMNDCIPKTPLHLTEEDEVEFGPLDEVHQWITDVQHLSWMSVSQPQVAYAAMTKSLQQEWIYLQWVVLDCSTLFAELEETLLSLVCQSCEVLPRWSSNYVYISYLCVLWAWNCTFLLYQLILSMSLLGVLLVFLSMLWRMNFPLNFVCMKI